jgi:hypothetical protein
MTYLSGSNFRRGSRNFQRGVGFRPVKKIPPQFIFSLSTTRKAKLKKKNNKKTKQKKNPKNSQIPISVRLSGPLSRRDGSLLCHTCCVTGPRFFRSHPKERPIPSPLTTHIGMSLRMRPRSCVKAGVAW